MAKRFTDTNKYKKPFIRGLKGAYKLLWDYLYHDCDHAGIWIVDFEIAKIYIGSDMEINQAEALKNFNKGECRIVEFDNGTKWFIPSFIDFQYGVLNENNRAHNSVIQILTKHKLFNNKELTRGLQDPKDMDMDKELDMDKEKPFNFKNELLLICPNIEVIKTFLEIRKKKKATNSEIAFNALKTEFEKSKKTPEECLTICCEKSWAGFKAEWIDSNPSNIKGANPRQHTDGETNYTSEIN